MSVAIMPLHAQKRGAVPEGAASAPDRPLVLQAQDTIKTQFEGKLLNKTVCDDDGNIYARNYVFQKAVDGTLQQIPIQKIKPDGTLAESYRVTDAGADLSADDFFVSNAGDMYVSASNSKGENFLISFASDGSIKSKTRIERDGMMTYQVAIFKAGEILLSGTEGEKGHTPFAGVFGTDGKLIGKLASSGDEEFKKAAEAGDPNFAPQSTGGYGNTSVHLGEAAAGSDGNVYLMRSSLPALVYAINPRGEVLRTIKIDPGESSMVAIALKSAPGKLAVVFRERSSGGHYGVGGLVRVVDYEGNALATYLLKGPQDLGFFACYVPPSFEFVNTRKDGFNYRTKAEPR